MAKIRLFYSFNIKFCMAKVPVLKGLGTNIMNCNTKKNCIDFHEVCWRNFIEHSRSGTACNENTSITFRVGYDCVLYGCSYFYLTVCVCVCVCVPILIIEACN